MKKVLFLIFALFFVSNSVFAAYEFEIKDRKITYQEDELKFYENDELLTPEKVNLLFPEYQLLLISDFDKNKKYTYKNSLFKSKNILLVNDTNRTFHKFFIYPESSRNQLNKEDKKCLIKSLITIYGKKNVRLKHEGGDEFEIVVK
ncbi:MAG: hypothetical protein IJ003_01370 [Candidatus Gastranaerophilales bacterium]|nr:hypothetical protein [Candidatus Gastranaerophilales bacterium]